MSLTLKAQAIINLDENTSKQRNQEIVNQIIRNLTHDEKKKIIEQVKQNPQSSSWIKDNVEKMIF